MPSPRPHTPRAAPRHFTWELHSTCTLPEPPLAWDGTDCGAACGCKVVPLPETPARPQHTLPSADTGSQP